MHQLQTVGVGMNVEHNWGEPNNNINQQILLFSS